MDWPARDVKNIMPQAVTKFALPESLAEELDIKFVAEFPTGFDGITKITMYDRPDRMEIEVIITHPDMPAHRLNRQEKRFEEIKGELHL